MTRKSRFCDGVNRRDFLRLGAAAVFGANLSLPRLLAASTPKDTSLIFVFLHGGLSTIDTFDMKPDAPAEIRGEFKPVATNVDGIQICDLLPQLGQQADKYSLIRSFRHPDSNHGPADHYMFTGYAPGPGFNPGLTPNNQRPAHGSVIAKKLGPRGPVPAYVCLPKMHPSAGAAYLGAGAAPFVIEADPNAPNFSVPDVLPPASVDASRLDARKELLGQVDRFQAAAEARANRGAREVSTFREKAFGLMTSPEAKKAFAIQDEPAKLRDEYGRNALGQGCLMARRLVEAGVRCVSLDHSNWDTHNDNFNVLKNTLLPAFDSAIATLFRDLADRGMLEKTLVLVTGEFGRTPRINKDAGRDHWGPAFTVLLGGGGIHGGRVIGKTDARAERPAEAPHGPENLSATMYHLLGVDPEEEFYTPEGRPIKIVNDGKLIDELL
jgi:uncharacterized protein (DUF1501 family)